MCEEELSIGMVGLDSSHCVKFTELLHCRDHPCHVDGGRVVCAFPGGTEDWDLSASRVGKFTEQMRDEFGVEIVETPEEVAQRSDVVMVTSVDGGVHREQFERVAGLGKPVFIDKPLALTGEDAHAIATLAGKRSLPWFTSSVWRYTSSLLTALENTDATPFSGGYVTAPWPLHPGRTGWFWYGVHAVEILYAGMKTGCLKVESRCVDDIEIITGWWPDGRTGIIRGDHRPEASRSYGGIFHTPKQSYLMEPLDTLENRYAGLLHDVVKLGKGLTPPRDEVEMVEVIRFMDAAFQSRQINDWVALQ